jgi:hypothetical protein
LQEIRKQAVQLNTGGLTMRIHVCKLLPVLLLVLFSSAVQAEKTVINDAAALADLKTGKGVFLVDIGAPTRE